MTAPKGEMRKKEHFEASRGVSSWIIESLARR